jgi:reversibly glycosylated polypeptide / UDP-arabinopyranose mutase
MTRTLLVVPSCRAAGLEAFFRAWDGKGGWDEALVVEDGPVKTFPLPGGVHHYSWREVEATLGADAWVISRRDSACRCFGFLWAWWRGFDHVLTLDDDCCPHEGHGSLAALHRLALERQPRWRSSVRGLRVRGIPYRNKGHLPGVVANVGLWSDNPDFDAPTSLVLGDGAGFEPPGGSRVVPQGVYVPVCGMNLFLAREALPLFYFPPMGEGSPFRRFDDIWAGVLAKKALDHLGWRLGVGEPFVRHRRASDPFVNLQKEAAGIAANETFWEAVDAVPLKSSDPVGAAHELGRGLAGSTDPYLAKLGAALQTWARLFVERPAGL